ncbi:unnamed protein product [Caenorhabditis bovis]|uniref:Uncharacterized protein n=1 Tax=Caenorhabditis bovis TaxID=2654633 RepID=A0A8S1F3N1_9PELO|nr:unnamed protein product [Caenorhabditis bovis]
MRNAKQSREARRATRQQSQSDATTCVMSELDHGTDIELFNPNHQRYLCCCGHAHALTGMRIISGMLIVTVLFELWKLIVTIFANGVIQEADIVHSAVRFLIGTFIGGTVLWSILAEKAILLIPYLVIQGTGLAIAMVFFVALIYISLFGDKRIGNAVLKSFGINIKLTEEGYINYAAGLMAGSFAIVIALQIWLMCIVITCWRYLRDKKNNERHNSLIMMRANQRTNTRLRVSFSEEAISSLDLGRKRAGTLRSFSNSLEI